jgi:hypothetical protein
MVRYVSYNFHYIRLWFPTTRLHLVEFKRVVGWEPLRAHLLLRHARVMLRRGTRGCLDSSWGRACVRAHRRDSDASPLTASAVSSPTKTAAQTVSKLTSL